MPKKKKIKKISHLASNRVFENKKFSKSLGYIFAIFFILIGLALVGVFGMALAFNTKFYPKTKVAGIEVASLLPEEAFHKIEDEVNNYKKETLLIACGEKQEKIKISDLKPNFLVEETLQKLFALGHPQSFKEILIQLPDILKLLLFHYNMSLIVEIGEPNKIKEIQEKISNLPTSASFFLENDELKIKKEEPGFGVSEEELKSQLLYALSFLQKEIALTPKVLSSEFKEADLLGLKPKVEEILKQAPLKLMLENEQRYSLSKQEILSLLTLSNGDKARFAVKESGKQEIYPKIKEKIDREPKNARLEIRNQEVFILEPEQAGFLLNEDDLTQKLVAFFNSPKDVSKIDLTFIRRLPEIHSGNFKDFVLSDLLGKGETFFYGSSNNRIHNIRTGSSKLHGLVVSKGATFSLGEALGNVSSATGYVEELVIKQNRTVPEYGGGLCQVATTLFRAILYSGLPVLERHNHAYRVGYYEPPIGMDATIYYPQVDLKFENNTEGPILIQTNVSGYKASFYFYGKSDGREVNISNPVGYNYTPPSPPTYIDDPNMLKGEEKYEERAHWGADADFSYKVYRQGKLIYEKNFHSHYKAWPAIIRRGIKE